MLLTAAEQNILPPPPARSAKELACSLSRRPVAGHLTATDFNKLLTGSSWTPALSTLDDRLPTKLSLAGRDGRPSLQDGLNEGRLRPRGRARVGAVHRFPGPRAPQGPRVGRWR